MIDAEAAAALERALDEARGSWLATGFLLARAGVLEEAEQAFAKLAELNPRSPEAGAAAGSGPSGAPHRLKHGPVRANPSLPSFSSMNGEGER